MDLLLTATGWEPAHEPTSDRSREGGRQMGARAFDMIVV